MMYTPISFDPGASVEIRAPAGAIPLSFPMPPVDANTPDLVVTNKAPHPVHLAFGDGARADPERVGGLTVKAGQSLLLSVTEGVNGLRATLAQVNQPHRAQGGPSWELDWVRVAANATSVSLLSFHAGAVVAITRGRAVTGIEF